jgi:hypothetical protein
MNKSDKEEIKILNKRAKIVIIVLLVVYITFRILTKL